MIERKVRTGSWVDRHREGEFNEEGEGGVADMSPRKDTSDRDGKGMASRGSGDQLGQVFQHKSHGWGDRCTNYESQGRCWSWGYPAGPRREGAG